jgi:hypothetical protein
MPVWPMTRLRVLVCAHAGTVGTVVAASDIASICVNLLRSTVIFSMG